ncbi:M20 family metallopeptidase [Glutamicibacter sp.]|uniref:M20 family metallopeptidase n=1 Tax=Glutamicibacter sp. TaxID=1931995 RepID=UPI0028BECCE7|nr:M20 family metallopeptidase [Glutamicibacter sp.]
MSKHELLEKADECATSGRLFEQLATLVAHPTVSGTAEGSIALDSYLGSTLRDRLESLGFTVDLDLNWNGSGNSFLRARRIEHDDLPTVLCYGHADVVDGQDEQWSLGLQPFELTAQGDHWYGRGAADNKGQHLVNLLALEFVLQQRRSLGFNITFLFEAGEEIGSPQLDEYAKAHRASLQADVFIASDGPRQRAEVPTIFLGARGGASFELSVPLRNGGFHSGNWGGVLRNPATTLAAAIGVLVDGDGRIRVPELLPEKLPSSVLQALSRVEVGGDVNDPIIDPSWGDPSLSTAERLYGWNSLEVLALQAANIDEPINAIPGTARANLQLRFVVGTDPQKFESAIRGALDDAGYSMVQLRMGQYFPASRIEPDNPWVQWASTSITDTIGYSPVVLPNIGGSLPNQVFEQTLDLPTLWIPHSYPGCKQHAPDEHALEPVLREGLKMMCGLFYDLGTCMELPSMPTYAKSER